MPERGGRHLSANSITLSRFPLLLICVALLYLGSPPVQVAGAALVFLGLMLDTVDGMVARTTVTDALRSAGTRRVASAAHP